MGFWGGEVEQVSRFQSCKVSEVQGKGRGNVNHPTLATTARMGHPAYRLTIVPIATASSLGLNSPTGNREVGVGGKSPGWEGTAELGRFVQVTLKGYRVASGTWVLRSAQDDTSKSKARATAKRTSTAKATSTARSTSTTPPSANSGRKGRAPVQERLPTQANSGLEWATVQRRKTDVYVVGPMPKTAMASRVVFLTVYIISSAQRMRS